MRVLPEPTEEATVEPDGALLRAFGEVTERRFGLWRTSRQLPSLERRLEHTLRACQLTAAQGWSLVRTLESAPEESPWVQCAANVVPNQSTSFFRDAVQLEALIEALATRPGQKLRLLSAGCSSGEEPYSLAMLALEGLVHQRGTQVDIVGLDVSAGVLAQAERARYGERSISRTRELGPSGWVERWMRPEGDQYELKGAPRQMVQFVRRNLAVPHALAGLGFFDAIICRNVLLYFAPDRTREVVQELAAHLAPGGLLMLGPTEMLPEPPAPGTERVRLGPWTALRAEEAFRCAG
jgi:chemotaxis protein methyltransferase CheR